MKDLDLLLEVVDRAYNRRSWHGTNLRGSIRGVTARAAAWRPGKNRHNIWELVVHAAYWKYAVWRRLTGVRRGSFPLKGSNFFIRPSKGRSSESAWKQDVALLDRTHRDLRALLQAYPSGELRRARGKYRSFELIAGIAAHDLYHAGQIQLLKRLHARR